MTAAGVVRERAAVYNVPGAPATVDDVIASIRAVLPGAEITADGDPLPFPEELEAVAFDREVGRFPRTPLDVGVAATIEHFRAA